VRVLFATNAFGGCNRDEYGSKMSGVEPNSTNNDDSGSLPRDWLADSLAGSVLIKHCRSAD
jgi:hypothetical protein